MAAGNVVIGDSNIGTTPAQAHDNMPPFTAVRYIIALQGLFPSRN
jgi:microcystin-dependent protein